MKHEKEFKIKIPDSDKYIYAKQYGPLTQPVVIFVHGLTGFMDEHMFYNGARYFFEKGFSSIRFNLYDFDEDSRKLIDCTLETHAFDLDAIVADARGRGAENIFVAGHSYGGPTILMSQDQYFKAMALWDPSHDIVKRYWAEEAEYNKDLDNYLVHWQIDFVLGKAMYEEADNLDWDNLIATAKKPVKIIAAGNGELMQDCEKYFEQAPEPKELTVIEGATHSFNEEGKAEELYDETVNWFKKYL